MLDRCIPVAPDCFPTKNNRRYIQCTTGKACIRGISGTAEPLSAQTPLSRIIRSRPSSFRLRRSFGSGRHSRTRITTTGSLQIIFTQTTHRLLRNIPPQSHPRKKRFSPVSNEGKTFCSHKHPCRRSVGSSRKSSTAASGCTARA